VGQCGGQYCAQINEEHDKPHSTVVHRAHADARRGWLSLFFLKFLLVGGSVWVRFAPLGSVWVRFKFFFGTAQKNFSTVQFGSNFFRYGLVRLKKFAGTVRYGFGWGSVRVRFETWARSSYRIRVRPNFRVRLGFGMGSGRLFLGSVRVRVRVSTGSFQAGFADG